MKLYYCKMDNFGDKLNEYIFTKCFGIPILYSDSWHADAVGIGSILDSFLLQTKDFYKLYKINPLNINKPVKLLSCGFGHESEYYKNKLRFFKSTFFKRKIYPISIRGELSKRQISTIVQGIDFSNTVLGDLGLLSSNLIENAKPDKIYNLGICPHYADFGNKIFLDIQKDNPESIIIDTRQNPIDFLKAISRCKTIISTGLHPLIAADSLGIPNLWCRLSEKTTTRHKYYDYYSVFSIAPKPYDITTNKIKYKDIFDCYNVDQKFVEEIKQKLFDHHKKHLSISVRGEFSYE